MEATMDLLFDGCIADVDSSGQVHDFYAELGQTSGGIDAVKLPIGRPKENTRNDTTAAGGEGSGSCVCNSLLMLMSCS